MYLLDTSVTSDMQMIPHLGQTVKKNERASWWKWKREWKLWLKTQHSKKWRSHHFLANRWGNNGNSERLLLEVPKSLQMVIAAMKLKDACSLEKSYNQPRQHIKKQRQYFANKCQSSQSYGFSSSHVWMWELDYKQSWVPKNWCFWTVVLEKTLESPLDCKEIKPVHPKGNQPLTFIGRTDAKVETPIFWPPDGKSGLIGQDTDAGQDWSQQEKGKIEDEVVGRQHQLDGHESEQALGVSDGQGSAAVHGVTKSRTQLSGWTEEVKASIRTQNCLSPLKTHSAPLDQFSSDLDLIIPGVKF